MRDSSWSVERSAVSAELKRFIAEKCAQVRAEARAPEHEMGPESRALFTAAEDGDWRGVFESLAAMHRAMREPKDSRPRSRVLYPVEWAAVNEIGAALEEFAAGDESYAVRFARDIISSIPAGSIYFGGTDAGRFLVTALSCSHIDGNPFFTVAQDALVDYRSYLRCLRGMYGSRIHIPSEEDVTMAFHAFQDDLRRRKAEGKLVPGESFEEVGKVDELRNWVSVMAINGKLSELMFERNQEREFYLEEGFPVNWMYPRLTPNGLILKINRRKYSELPADEVQRDHDYWSRYITPMIGDWLNYQTSLSEIVGFVERVYLSRDFGAFAGDPQFIQNEARQKPFSKLRSSIGGLYAWRARNASNPADKEAMLREADFAFRQAFVLCPLSPEAVFRYTNLLLGVKRLDAAILVTEAAVKLGAKAEADVHTRAHIQEDFSHKPQVPSQANPQMMVTQLGSLLEQLRRMKGK